MVLINSGHGRDRVKDFTILTIMYYGCRGVVSINHYIAQILLKLFVLSYI
jgi:hypothetical protein